MGSGIDNAIIELQESGELGRCYVVQGESVSAEGSLVQSVKHIKSVQVTKTNRAGFRWFIVVDHQGRSIEVNSRHVVRVVHAADE